LLQIIILLLFLSKNSYSASLSLIRDSQIEDFLTNITNPLIAAANLEKQNIKIHIVNNQNINAFVTQGQNIFINTGLILKYKDPNILTGVIAHEIGHISGGHLAQGYENMRNANNIAILGYIAGIAAAITSDTDAGMAILMGSNQVTQRLALKYNRSQEEAADRLALKYLKETNNSPIGLMTLLQYFKNEETEYINLVDEYSLTHPVNTKRINFIKSNLDKFPKYQRNIKEYDEIQYIIAKLIAFLESGNRGLKIFTSNSPYDIYGRSISYFKKGKIKKSLTEIDKLINIQPNNGYFHELKGQIQFESGFITESIKSYKKSIQLLPNPILARIALSSAILSLKQNDRELINFAINNLNDCKIKEPENRNILKQLAGAYNKINQIGRSYVILSELNLLKKKHEKAKKFAKLALEKLEKDDNIFILRANDIMEIINTNSHL
jgi:predicted Zn-dependent protease